MNLNPVISIPVALAAVLVASPAFAGERSARASSDELIPRSLPMPELLPRTEADALLPSAPEPSVRASSDELIPRSLPMPEPSPRTEADALLPSAPEPPLVTALRERGSRVAPLGGRGGLDGFLVTPAEGGAYTLYVTGEGYGVAGLLYGPDGKLLTVEQVAAAEPGPDLHASGTPGAEPGADREALFAASTGAFGFTLGESGPEAVLFADPRCPWSRSSVARLGQEALAGTLRLHVVPVALLGAASARRAAEIASAANPAQAWFAGEVGPGGPEARARIARNNALFDAWGESGVPLTAYRARDGGIARRVGDIADVGAWLRELGDE